MLTPWTIVHHIPIFVLVPQAAHHDENNQPSFEAKGKKPSIDNRPNTGKKSKHVEDNKTKSAAGKKSNK